MDCVNVDDIFPLLSNYKYYDFNQNNNILDLVKNIREVVKNILKQKTY